MVLKWPVITVAPWGILLLSFAVLAFSYDSIAKEVLIARDLFGGGKVVAEKSLFTVFRVPLIDTICAAAIAIVFRKFLLTALDLSNFWLILLYTAAFKSLFQVLEIVSSPYVAEVCVYMTVAVVVTGITYAFYTARKHLSGFVKALGKFSRVESLTLVLLLIAYLGVAIVPSFVYQ